MKSAVKTSSAARLIAWLLIGGMLAACGGGPTPPPLPTATPNPTLPVPTSTPTPLPPPTVTPFPTGASGGGAVLPTNAPGGEAGGAPTVPPTPIPDQPTPTPPPPTPPSPPPTPTQTEGIPPGVKVGNKIFSADFYQGWPSVNEQTAKIRIIGGRYVFEIGPFDARFITTEAVNEANTFTRVEASPDRCTGGLDGGYGLLFRYVDADNYYLVTFFCDNTFTVIAKVNGSFFGGIYAGGPLPAGLDATTPQPHSIGVLSKGDTHTLFLDDQQIATFEADQHDKGDVALYAVSSGEKVVVVGFDNLAVWQAQ